MRIEMCVVFKDVQTGEDRKIGLASIARDSVLDLHGHSSLMMNAIIRKLLTEGLVEDPSEWHGQPYATGAEVSVEG